MSRAKYIYLALDEDGHVLLACTVKHEFYTTMEMMYPDIYYRIYRCEDNNHGSMRLVDEVYAREDNDD